MAQILSITARGLESCAIPSFANTVSAPLLDPSFVSKFYAFQRIEDRKKKRVFFIKYCLIQTLQPSGYHALRAIIAHLSGLLTNESEQMVLELVKPLVLCLTKSEDVHCMLPIYLILRYGNSMFTSQEPPSQIDITTDLDSWGSFYSLTDTYIWWRDQEDVEIQILLHEIVCNVRRTVGRLDTLQRLHKRPLLKAVAGSHEGKLYVQKLLEIADAVRATYVFLLKQLQYRQQEEGPWITGFSDIFRAWLWVFKSSELHHTYMHQTELARKANMIPTNFSSSEASLKGSLAESLGSPFVSVQQFRVLFMAIYDKMWNRTRWKLLQVKETAEQAEHKYIMETIEGLDPCAYAARNFATIGGQNVTKDERLTSPFDIHSSKRVTLYQGNVLMSTSENAYKIIKAVEGILYSDFFVLVHRHWERNSDRLVTTDITYIINNKVSSHHLNGYF